LLSLLVGALSLGIPREPCQVFHSRV